MKSSRQESRLSVTSQGQLSGGWCGAGGGGGGAERRDAAAGKVAVSDSPELQNVKTIMIKCQ